MSLRGDEGDDEGGVEGGDEGGDEGVLELNATFLLFLLLLLFGEPAATAALSFPHRRFAATFFFFGSRCSPLEPIPPAC